MRVTRTLAAAAAIAVALGSATIAEAKKPDTPPGQAKKDNPPPSEPGPGGDEDSKNKVKSNGSGNPTIIDVPGSCNIFAPPYKCSFDGNISTNEANLTLVETEYNSQDPGVTPPLLELSDLLKGEFTPSSEETHSGNIIADFIVDFYAVKGSDGFILYHVPNATLNTFNWTTAGLVNGGGNEPGMSHLVWFGHKGDLVVPEPGAWALMILGFGGVGAMLRRRRFAVAA